MAQEYKSKQTQKHADEQEIDEAPEQVEVNVNSEELEDFLDEIDEVLEVNAQEFVQNYIQKGGQ